MAEGSDRNRLPIKLILPNQGRERRVTGGGGPAKPFRPVTRNYRSNLQHQVIAIRDMVARQESASDTPVRVKLLVNAAAKSHRPEHLFSPQTCPIIGAGRLGELFVKASRKGLEQLATVIQSNTSERIVKELSTVEAIEPVTPLFRRRGKEAREILKHSPRGKDGFLTRVRLFDFGWHGDQEDLVSEFQALCKAKKLRVDGAGYAHKSYVYTVECKSESDVEALSRVVGVRSIVQTPLIRTLRPRMLNAQPLPEKLLTAADAGGDFPVVVVVDSGVSDHIPQLETWIVGRESAVAENYRNTTHGTFVAGLICWGSQLNPNLDGIDENPCGVLDLQVLPNTDPAKGDIDSLNEQEFLQALEGWLKQYANKYKVWNLSLSTSETCSLDEFSPLAEALDDLQEKYQVSFVISAGNFETPPLLDYPRTNAQEETGRITCPADSVLAVTVGAVSHIDYAKNGPKKDHPSAFSRHGAGPNHIIKPDLVHYGGTCSTDLAHASGVRSVGETGSAEDLGTSFSTPLVSRTLAQIFHQITPTPSPVLARALLTHHARDPRHGGRVPDGEENYLGFGLPAPVPYCLECTPHTATLVFEDALRPGYHLEWDDFPYPNSLRRNGRYYGEIWMTVAFAPARGARWGTEYCETHIDAHFGVYFTQKSRGSGMTSVKFRGLVPPEHKNPGQLYESYQVEKLRKWAPVRTYHGALGDNGERGDRWRLMVRLLTRHGIDDAEAFKPQPFGLIITIADPEKKAPVYDEVSQIVLNRFKAENLTLRTAARVRVQS